MYVEKAYNNNNNMIYSKLFLVLLIKIPWRTVSIATSIFILTLIKFLIYLYVK